MKQNKKLNKLVKATSMVAFLFGIVALTSPCITSFQSCKATSEGIHSEVTSSSSLTKVDATRSCKNANRQIETNTYLVSDVMNDGWIYLEYYLLDYYNSYLDNNDNYECELQVTCSIGIEYNYIYDIYAQDFSLYFFYYDGEFGFEYDTTDTSQVLFSNSWLSCSLDIDMQYLTFIVSNGEDFEWMPVENRLCGFLPGRYSFTGGLNTDIIGYETNNIKQIIKNNELGLFKNADISYGVLDVDTLNFVGPTPSTSIDILNGGYKTINSNWTAYEEYLIDMGSDYFLGNVVEFVGGIDISPYKYLLPLGSNGNNIFLFGQSLYVYFNNGYVWSVNGADLDYGISAFDITEIIKLSGSNIVNKIIFTGNNSDYIPYGLSTSTDYTAGYDNGYKTGYDNGIESGYNNGYLEGKNDIDEERYQDGYNKGYDDATNRYSDGSLSLNGVLNAIVTAPSKIIKEGLDFDILGFNVGKLVMSLIVIGLVVWAIGFFKKG